MILQKKFVVDKGDTNKVLGRAVKFIHERLSALKLSARDTNKAVLMCEESLLRLFRYSDFTAYGAFRVNVRKFFGDVLIDLTVPGAEFDFAASIELSDDAKEELSPDTEAAIQNLMLRSFADNVRYKRIRNFNRITVKAYRSNYSGLYKTLTALVMGVIAGLSAKYALPENMYMLLNDNVLAAFRTIFMNGLKMCAVPVVFFSIAANASDMGNFSGMRRSGTRLLKWFAAIQVIAVLIGFTVIWLLGTGKGAELNIASDSSVSAEKVSLISAIINIMPANVILPFLEGNMLQLILFALLAGTAASATGSKIVIQAFNELNEIFMKITGYLTKFMPIVIFCSIASMIITTGMNTIIAVLGVLFALCLGYTLLNAAFCILLKFRAGVSPKTAYRKSLPVITSALSTCSSSACLPEMVKTSENMGVSPRLCSFSIPLGISINKPAICLVYTVTVLAAVNMYGVNLSVPAMFSAAVSILILALATPALPSGGAATMAVLVSQAGCPLEVVPLFVSADAITDMLNTVTTCMANMACTLGTAANENMLDLEKFNRS